MTDNSIKEQLEKVLEYKQLLLKLVELKVEIKEKYNIDPDNVEFFKDIQ